MATEKSLLDNPDRSGNYDHCNISFDKDEPVTNKRLKTDRTDNQLQQICTSNNHHLFDEQTKVNKAVEKDPMGVSQTDGYTIINKDRPSDFEIIPNELFFQICSYMNHIDIVRAFIGLNQRFNALTFECVRQFEVLNTVPPTWYVENMAYIEHAIELISLPFKTISKIFLRNNSLPNLRSIIIKRPTSFTVKLNVEHCSSVDAIISCLNLLQSFCIWTQDLPKENQWQGTPRNAPDPNGRMSIALLQKFYNTFPCTAIERLSVHVWDAKDWICLSGRALNLTHLEIIYDELDEPIVDPYPLDLTFMFDGPSRLTNLCIYFGYNHICLRSLEWLISHCRSSLKRFTLNAADSDQINGQSLETLLQPCQQLTKLEFSLKLESHDIDRMEILRQYQTDWWLDPCRPPVFLHDNGDYIFIVTMPCTMISTIDLDINPNTWLLNKGQLDSSLICFKNVTSIGISNTEKEPVTFDFLHLVARMFPAPHQNLDFIFWGFHQSEILYEQLKSGAAITPQLPHVQYFGKAYIGYYGLDAISLIIWLLVALNVRELNLTRMSNDNTSQLAKDLDRMLQTDPDLQLVFNRMEKIDILPSHNDTDESLKRQLFLLFSKLFPKAIVHYSTFLLV